MIICNFVLLSDLVKLQAINSMHIVISILVVLKGKNSSFYGGRFKVLTILVFS
jgi:hypothetical protein